jgi:HlyD family secretion protein
MKAVPAVLLIAALAGGCSRGANQLVTVPVKREAIVRTVTATGTLSPQDTVLVGSQVSGTIQALYVDYNSQVHTGEVLARLDPSLFDAALAQSRKTYDAALSTAQSAAEQIAAADENIRKARSALSLAQITQWRDATLLKQGYVAQNVVDNDMSISAAARAAVVAAQSNAQSARSTYAADVQQAQSAQAAMHQEQINLDHATIVSPVDGTVIQRNVSVGQTVAAALQAPTLFTIAKDLTKMELDIAVGEPDVGAVRAGQRVSFSVLAYPGRSFATVVDQVRQNPTIVNNVTTYDTVAYPSNRDGALRSGMTANVRIAVQDYPNALIVPLAALQWQPSSTVLKSYRLVEPQSGEGIPVKRSLWGATGTGNAFAVTVGNRARCYVLDGKILRGVLVNVLAINGTQVGVSVAVGTLAPNEPVVVDQSS